MLVLNRKTSESIIIDENIEIKILDIVDGKIKIGIEAPKDISILRKEVYENVKAENIASLETKVNIMDVINNI
ncbi:MAG: carbon storage regulator CsrA [Eubacteriaceae bacterium]